MGCEEKFEKRHKFEKSLFYDFCLGFFFGMIFIDFNKILKNQKNFMWFFMKMRKFFIDFWQNSRFFTQRARESGGKITKIEGLPTFLGKFDQISCNFVKIVKINEKYENVQENMMVDFRQNSEDLRFWRKSRFQRFLRSGDGPWGMDTSKVRLFEIFMGR